MSAADVPVRRRHAAGRMNDDNDARRRSRRNDILYWGTAVEPPAQPLYQCPDHFYSAITNGAHRTRFADFLASCDGGDLLAAAAAAAPPSRHRCRRRQSKHRRSPQNHPLPRRRRLCHRPLQPTDDSRRLPGTVKPCSHCTRFVVVQQYETEQWNNLKVETPWKARNRAVKHYETAWNSMKQKKDTLKRHEAER